MSRLGNTPTRELQRLHREYASIRGVDNTAAILRVRRELKRRDERLPSLPPSYRHLEGRR